MRDVWTSLDWAASLSLVPPFLLNRRFVEESSLRDSKVNICAQQITWVPSPLEWQNLDTVGEMPLVHETSCCGNESLVPAYATHGRTSPTFLDRHNSHSSRLGNFRRHLAELTKPECSKKVQGSFLTSQPACISQPKCRQ